jgi:hypothetical protein
MFHPEVQNLFAVLTGGDMEAVVLQTRVFAFLTGQRRCF